MTASWNTAPPISAVGLAGGLADYMADTLRAAGWRVFPPGTGAIPKAARKAPAAGWPGRKALVDDPAAGFVAADWLAASRAGWHPPAQRSELVIHGAAQPVPMREELVRFAVDRDGGTAMLPQLTADLR